MEPRKISRTRKILISLVIGAFIIFIGAIGNCEEKDSEKKVSEISPRENVSLEDLKAGLCEIEKLKELTVQAVAPTMTFMLMSDEAKNHLVDENSNEPIGLEKYLEQATEQVRKNVYSSEVKINSCETSTRDISCRDWWDLLHSMMKDNPYEKDVMTEEGFFEIIQQMEVEECKVIVDNFQFDGNKNTGTWAFLVGKTDESWRIIMAPSIIPLLAQKK